ncbi:MAG: glutamine-hydrolyzing carbamoyl-phosphate synthase small subunit [PS1 clade bacterium]|uniref:Carbamoyl phosphate synthase small chain n=1 Tax=PS1 clade bacterium TaxID=2175152 RepID=A0A937HDC1_9PROT|nr:glutamine-hydrolyzing carbamoyl-phosphate synthase small subunit [PS1 clade bacterium]
MSVWSPAQKTALLLTDTGETFYGYGIGATGHTIGEVCFNTAMTGYQEILTDPSYAGQIVTFTFPHIGNVGTNDEDSETSNTRTPRAAHGLIIREAISAPANYRTTAHLDDWLSDKGLVGISGIDTRSVTAHIRENGMFNAVLAHAPDGVFDIDALKAELAAFAGLEGADLAAEVTSASDYDWGEGRWSWNQGFTDSGATGKAGDGPHVVALDYGVKKNILRCLVEAGCRVTVLPADSTADVVLDTAPDGIFLSNGPGDPAATGDYAVAEIEKLVASGKPVFGICLGHQMLARALGARTVKMKLGHHGANHPVKDVTTGKVEITSMNHGFTVDRDTLPDTVEETHISLFDGTNCGIRLKDKPVFSVQYHPEASPGPQDSHYLFDRFVTAMRGDA